MNREDIAGQVRIFKTTVSHWLHNRGHRLLPGLKRWTPTYWKWVRALPLPPMDRLTPDHYLDVLSLLDDRRRQVEEQISALGEQEPYRGQVRFRSAPGLMKFAGLIPLEHSSGDRIRRGKITKAGNSHIRHVLVEAVQKAHVSARPGRALLRRWHNVSGPLRQIAVDCLKRLHYKF